MPPKRTVAEISLDIDHHRAIQVTKINSNSWKIHCQAKV
jgi:hypothetical protein